MTHSTENLVQQVRLLEQRLRMAHVVAGVACLMMLLGGLVALTPVQQRQRFSEIDVERINIVETDGRIRLVISNRDRSPPPMLRGQPFGYSGGTRPGLISYNDEVTENGGFIWGGGRKPDGSYWAEQSLTFDQFEQDQIIALQYIDANGTRRHGLQILDRSRHSIVEQDSAWKVVDALSPGPARDSAIAEFRAKFPVAQRVYVGRDREKSAIVVLGDGRGRPRLRLSVDSAGAATIQFLDESGNVVHSLPRALKGGA